MVSTQASVNPQRFMKDITIGVKVQGLRRFRFRLWLGQLLIRLAAIVIGCNIKIEDERGA